MKNIVINATVCVFISMIVFGIIDAVKHAREMYRVTACHQKQPAQAHMTDREYAAYLAGKLGQDRFDVRPCNSTGTYVIAEAL